LIVSVNSFPFRYDVVCKFTSGLFTQHFLVEWLAVLAPALLRIL
jgi:hypothetical protein